MKPQFDPTHNSFLLTVTSDIISTKVDEMKSVFEESEPVLKMHPQCKHMLIHLENTHMIDSAGLNFIVSFYKHLQNHGVTTEIQCKDRNILRTLRFSRVDKYVKVTEIN